ncbi:MAG: phosphoribosylformylglycinamidine cyclo-ligase [Spirochaetia bacterium]|jgi:phosphoribosylformylglycinamidine cyclo-ligase|nr:phosphoribosylformylglycinamidine cyclo-ligase [Spirochaetia bacterium]
MGLTYKDSGVNVEGGNSFVKKITPIVKATFSERVITGIGGFSALFDGSFRGMKDPVLVSGTDGVGTKLQIAKKMNKHDTIGIDAVAMCVNDIITSGAEPLFFLDYISCGKLREDVLVDVVKGVADGCKRAGCSLVGGETAEHPGIMADDEYDIAGFAVGVVDRERIIDGSQIHAGDTVIGLQSSGIHSNGYSMVRKLFFDIKGYSPGQNLPGFAKPLGAVLLEPTRIYVKALLAVLKEGIPVKGIVHITGGGFHENIPRILPNDTSVVIDRSSFKTPDIFGVIQSLGDIADKEMFTTFNMGIGMILVTDKTASQSLVAALKTAGEKAAIIGEVTVNTGSRVEIL